ncbi:DciA family protein [Corynebacterium breve]|uniref:DciA family protein n=1 Tax=Corynebacterium breve TaxID=3049799 RepID=A0ABY8VDW3_9CORY|nr:DciA family protein [Corynebacterium breve]WIM67693.1 DciA family protein [Corynebacterium breve]
MTHEADDLVANAFQEVRKQARKRGRVPDLSHQGKNVVPRRAGRALSSSSDGPDARVPGLDLNVDEKQRYRGPGRMSGPDGRAPRKSFQVSSMNDLLKKEIRNRDWAKPLAHGWVMGSWEELVGEKIAQHTQVDMVKDGIVFISTDTTAWAAQLRNMKPIILQKLTDTIGEGIITDVKVNPPRTKSWRYGPLHVKGRGPRDTYG